MVSRQARVKLAEQALRTEQSLREDREKKLEVEPQ